MTGFRSRETTCGEPTSIALSSLTALFRGRRGDAQRETTAQVTLSEARSRRLLGIRFDCRYRPGFCVRRLSEMVSQRLSEVCRPSMCRTHDHHLAFINGVTLEGYEVRRFGLRYSGLDW